MLCVLFGSQYFFLVQGEGLESRRVKKTSITHEGGECSVQSGETPCWRETIQKCILVQLQSCIIPSQILSSFITPPPCFSWLQCNWLNFCILHFCRGQFQEIGPGTEKIKACVNHYCLCVLRLTSLELPQLRVRKFIFPKRTFEGSL